MARVKNGAVTKAHHKKVLKEAKGYFGSKHRLYKTAKEQLMHSGQYAFRDRKQKKRDFRKLWITRINAACRQNDISYCLWEHYSILPLRLWSSILNLMTQKLIIKTGR